MTGDQALAFAILAGALVLFVWGRFRYDVVAVLALLLSVFTGLVPPDKAFSGFSNPAVITVAAILIISQSLRDSGLVDMLARRMMPYSRSQTAHIASMTALVTVMSALINNVGALALVMPVAIATSVRNDRSPALLLMPLAFGSMLGGLMTLIGTPGNLIISDIRRSHTGEGFAMFDFAPVGISVAIVGVVFIAFFGWRLIPIRRPVTHTDALFDLSEYITELRVTERSPLVGRTLRDLERMGKWGITVAALIRGDVTRLAPPHEELLQAGDLLLVEGSPHHLREPMQKAKLELGPHPISPEMLRSHNVALAEAVVMPGSPLERQETTILRERHGSLLSLLAIARRGQRITQRMQNVAFQVGDVLLLQGEADRIGAILLHEGCVPLAARDLRHPSTPSSPRVPLVIFGIAIVASIAEWTTTAVAFVAAVVALVLTRQLRVRRLYVGMDLPILILLGALIPVGQALETTGAAHLLAHGLVSLGKDWPTGLILAVVILLTMSLSAVINNAATAVIMAPIALSMAADLGASGDAFLMAVAVGASCAFLTPIGHQSNLLVMGPGGYLFQDYWRLGLPLQLLVIAVAVPVLLLVF